MAAEAGVAVFVWRGPRFVECVGAGVASSPERFGGAEEDLAPRKRAGVDTGVLGCTD